MYKPITCDSRTYIHVHTCTVHMPCHAGDTLVRRPLTANSKTQTDMWRLTEGTKTVSCTFGGNTVHSKQSHCNCASFVHRRVLFKLWISPILGLSAAWTLKPRSTGSSFWPFLPFLVFLLLEPLLAPPIAGWVEPGDRPWEERGWAVGFFADEASLSREPCGEERE